MPSADYVTVLEDGCITRNQEPYGKLESVAKGVLKDIEADEVEENPSRPRDKSSAKKEVDLARQTGDTDCYKIYLRSMGWRIISIVFPLAVISTVLEVMPRELLSDFLV